MAGTAASGLLKAKRELMGDSREPNLSGDLVGLAEATDELVRALKRYHLEVSRLSDTTSDLGQLEATREVLSCFRAWGDAVFDRTGIDVCSLDERDDLDDDREDAEESGNVRAGGSSIVSIVSRFDLSVVDAAALLTAGRAAYLEDRDLDEPADPRQVIISEVDALRVIGDSFGSPWWSASGVEVQRGTIAYFSDAPDDDKLIDKDALSDVSPPDAFPAFVEQYESV